MMETAMCLIEANEPIYPIDILKSMRDQRAMLIQTSGQFVFVCSAILKVYKEQIVCPLKEFNQKLVVLVPNNKSTSILQQTPSSSTLPSGSPSYHQPNQSSSQSIQEEKQQQFLTTSQMIKT